MKTKNGSDLVIKIFIIVVAVILVGLLIAWTTGVFKDKKQDLNDGTEKIDHIVGSVADFDMLVYDGYTMKGNTLVELINEMGKKGSMLSIGVETLAKTKQQYNYLLSADNNLGTVSTAKIPSNKSDSNYINPTAGFLGSVIRNQNNEIVGLLFTQQK